jgi:hypothetical protein
MTPAGWYPDPANAQGLRWWDGAAWTDHVAESPARRPAIAAADVILGVALLGLGTAYWFVLRATSSSAEHDPFDSDWYWWSWFVLAGAAFLAGFARPALAAWWGWLALAPFAVLLAFAGTVFHDPDNGASMWLFGEVFVIGQAALTSVASKLGGRRRAPVKSA